MKHLIVIVLISIFTISCQEKEKKEASQKQDSNSQMDSVMIQPVDLNNTVFMMQYQVNSLVDSLFYAPPDKMEDIYEDLIFELNIIVSDIQNMSFKFEGSNELISSLEKLMLKYKDILENKYPPFLKILQSEEISTEDDQKIKKFNTEFNNEIIPLTKEFFNAQEKFAKRHKIELVDY